MLPSSKVNHWTDSGFAACSKKYGSYVSAKMFNGKANFVASFAADRFLSNVIKSGKSPPANIVLRFSSLPDTNSTLIFMSSLIFLVTVSLAQPGCAYQSKLTYHFKVASCSVSFSQLGVSLSTSNRASGKSSAAASPFEALSFDPPHAASTITDVKVRPASANIFAFIFLSPLVCI